MKRADGADPLQVVPVGRVGPRPDRSLDRDRVARRPRRGRRGSVAATRMPSTRPRRPQRRGLLTVAAAPVVSTIERPRAAAVRGGGGSAGALPASPASRTTMAGPTERDPAAWSTARARTASAATDGGQAEHGQGDGCPRDRARVAERATIAPTASQPLRGHLTRPSRASLSSANVFSPTSLRVRRSSTAANGRRSRDATILPAVTGPMPGSASSSAPVARFRSTARPLPDRAPAHRSRPARAGDPDRARRLSRWHPDLIAVLEERRQGSAIPARSVSTRGP